jgi:hypothetical protein
MVWLCGRFSVTGGSTSANPPTLGNDYVFTHKQIPRVPMLNFNSSQGVLARPLNHQKEEFTLEYDRSKAL